MKITNYFRAATLALFGTGIAIAGGEGWSTDYEAAKKEAASSHKSMLIDFTGSDWCSWCIKLNDEVFKHDEFKNGVKDKFVLLELDYPNDKSKQSAETIKQNEELSAKYKVEGYPTILLTDEEGRPFASTGYEKGGAEPYVKNLDKLLEVRKTRDEGFAKAEKAEGVEKAKALVSVLVAMKLNDSLVSNFYGETVEQIKKADPEDVTGFGKQAAAKERMSKFEAELNELGQKQDFDGALALVDKTLKEGNMEPEETQKVSLMRGLIFAQQKKFDEALAAIDAAKAIAPESEMGSRLDGLKKQIEAMKEKGAD